MGLDDYAGAVDAFTQGLERNRALPLLRGRAGCYRELGDLDKALGDLDEALALDADDYQARRLRADVRQMAGQLDGALADYELALPRVPAQERVALLNNYALTLSQALRLHEALALRSDLVELRGDWEAHFNRAAARLRVGRLEEALADWDRSLELAPPAARRDRVLAGRARTLWALGRHAEGLTGLREALELHQHALHALWLALLGSDPTLLEPFQGAGDVWGPLVAWATGRLSEEALLAAAEAREDEEERQRWRAQARCYLGLAAELAGDAERAGTHYQAVVDARCVQFLEWSWSRNALARLE
jgi:tetratricopeptide (TPR) repeat protein